MLKNKFLIKKKEIFYMYIYNFLYFLWIFFMHISSSQYFTFFDYESYTKIINFFILCILLFFFLSIYVFDKFTILDSIIILIFIISYFYSKTGLMLFVFTLLARYIKFSLIVKTFIISTLIGMVFIYFTYIFNLYSDTYLDLARNDSIRHLLGYRFPTFLPNYYFHIVLCWIFLRKNKLTFIELIFFSIINYVLYISTNTRAVFYLINLVLIVFIFVKYFNINYKTFLLGNIFKFFTIYSFLLFGFISIYLQFIFDPNIIWMNELNDLLSGRLKLGNRGIELYDITLFGNFIEYIPILEANNVTEFFYIDSAYMQLILTNGLILYIIILLGYHNLGCKICFYNKPYFGIVIVFLLMHSMTDPQLLLGEFNPFMLGIAYYGITKDKLFE